MNNYYSRIINLQDKDFEELAIEIFREQFIHNPVYQEYCHLLKIGLEKVHEINSIPFLPIQFYKTHIIKTGEWLEERIFLSSGTGSQLRSRQYLKSCKWYDIVSLNIFKKQVVSQISSIDKLVCIGLLPGYIDNPDSSLIQMIHSLSEELNEGEIIIYSTIEELNNFLNLHSNDYLIIFGVSFALYDWATQHTSEHRNLIIIETGGMKTDQRNLSKNEILKNLKNSFPYATIMSEYGMTELMSQAYSLDDFKYNIPPWMKIIITAIDDPFTQVQPGKRGRINVIDLANVDTCCFIQTGDVGIMHEDNRFEVIGRLQDEELRGCNFMA